MKIKQERYRREEEGKQKENITLKETVDFLNELLKIDPMSINALFNLRVYCNQNLAAHPNVQIGIHGKDNKIYHVGFIGILNGLFGSNEKGWGRMSINMDNGAIISFKGDYEKCTG